MIRTIAILCALGFFALGAVAGFAFCMAEKEASAKRWCQNVINEWVKK